MSLGLFEEIVVLDFVGDDLVEEDDLGVLFVFVKEGPGPEVSGDDERVGVEWGMLLEEAVVEWVEVCEGCKVLGSDSVVGDCSVEEDVEGGEGEVEVGGLDLDVSVEALEVLETEGIH